MNLLLYMAPMAVVFLLPATLMMEENVVGITVALARDDVKIVWYLLFNSALAYFVNLTNFLVTKHTSALTLQVCPTYSCRLMPLCFSIFDFHSNRHLCCLINWEIKILVIVIKNLLLSNHRVYAYSIFLIVYIHKLIFLFFFENGTGEKIFWRLFELPHSIPNI